MKTLANGLIRKLAAIPDDQRVSDPPVAQIILILRGQFTPQYKFRLGALGTRTMRECAAPSGITLLHGTQYTSENGYSQAQYVTSLDCGSLELCLSGFGQILHCLPSCYHLGFDLFVSKLRLLRSKYPSRMDLVWDFVLRVFKQQSERLRDFIAQLDDTFPKPWDLWSPALEELLKELLKEGEVRKNLAIRPLITSVADDSWPALAHNTGSSSSSSMSAEQTRLLGLLPALIATGIPKRERDDDVTPGGEGQAAKLAKKAAAKALKEKERVLAQAKLPPRVATPGTICPNTHLNHKAWQRHPELKNLCYFWHKFGACKPIPGKECVFKASHTSKPLSSAQESAALKR